MIVYNSFLSDIDICDSDCSLTVVIGFIIKASVVDIL